MATLDLKTALDLAKKDPNSPLAISLRNQIEQGLADEAALKQGVDLSPYGRPSLAELEKKQSLTLGTGEEALQDIKQIGTGIKEAAGRGEEKIGEIKQAYKSGEQGIFRSALQAIGAGAGFASQAIGETVLGAGKVLLPETAEQKVAGAVQKGVQKVAQTKVAQKGFKAWQTLEKENPSLARDIEGLVNSVMLGLDIVGLGLGSKATKAGAKAAGRAAKATGEALESGVETTTKLAKGAAEAAQEVIPSPERIVNYQVTRALDLTQGDVKNINLSTGNEVGEFLAQHNLIGKNKDDTVKMVQGFFNDNYDQVRNEIKNVTKVYTKNDVPRLTESLDQIKKQVGDVLGLEDVNKEVDKLLAQKSFKLNDVQRVKELLDEHFQLYKVTGDVKEGATKQGLSNIRKELKQFIEKEVKNKTGADIAPLNNNVSTSRSIMDAVEHRSTRGLTTSNIKLGDLGVFGAGTVVGSPLTGLALVAAKKILESSGIRLRIAKFLDKLSDARKAKIAAELESGAVPKEIQKIISTEK